ncbi:MAG: maleylpyruvate isomerase N-terminal domain-containing protein [Ignavibacteriales bacterium]|nr:maleylpyruvate isomerase N-terminal domain-containing protein [Ignavibacteriales bacterium]
MISEKDIPYNVVQLLKAIDIKLVALLQSLSPEEWRMPTIAKLWTVKDIAAHMLDTNIRILSILRDKYVETTPDNGPINDLPAYLNALNADWTKAMKRVSPEMLILLHKATGPLYCQYYESLSPSDTAKFPVSWIGETASNNLTHIARDYTEKWLHQQQIRDAVNKPGIMSREFYFPFLDIFMLGLPFTYLHTRSNDGTIVKITVTGPAGGSWFLVRQEGQWQLTKKTEDRIDSHVSISPDDAWKLFSKSGPVERIRNRITIEGDFTLGKVALNMVSVVA